MRDCGCLQVSHTPNWGWGVLAGGQDRPEQGVAVVLISGCFGRFAVISVFGLLLYRISKALEIFVKYDIIITTSSTIIIIA